MLSSEVVDAESEVDGRRPRLYTLLTPDVHLLLLPLVEYEVAFSFVTFGSLHFQAYPAYLGRERLEVVLREQETLPSEVSQGFGCIHENTYLAFDCPRLMCEGLSVEGSGWLCCPGGRLGATLLCSEGVGLFGLGKSLRLDTFNFELFQNCH